MESKELARLNKRLHKIGNELADKAKSIESEVTQWLVIGANEIRNTIILSMRNTPKTGRHYKVSKTGKPHIASSPGNAPAIRSGDLTLGANDATGGKSEATITNININFDGAQFVGQLDNEESA